MRESRRFIRTVEISSQMVEQAHDILAALGHEGETLRRLGVRRLALFGSAVRGELRADSDLDFLVELQPKTFDSYMDVKEFLESHFSHSIDLVLRSALKPELRDGILREAVDARLD